MNKGFAHYFKQGLKCAHTTIWKNKNLLQSVVYFFMSAIGKLLLLAPFVNLADTRHAKIAKRQQIIDAPQSFSKASTKSIWVMIVATILEALIYLGGFICLSAVCGLIMAIAHTIALSNPASMALIYIIFAVPCLLIYLIYTIIVLAIFSPTGYVVDTNPSLSSGEVIAICVRSLKNRGMFTAILTMVVPALIELVVLGIIGAIYYVLIAFAGGKNFSVLLYVIWGIISLVLMLLTIPSVHLTKCVALNELCDDIALDPVNAGKRTAGINIKSITGAKLDRDEVADNLNALFYEGVDERMPEPEDVQHKNKKRAKNVDLSEKKSGGVAVTEDAAPDENLIKEIENFDEYAEDVAVAEKMEKEAQAKAEEEKIKKEQEAQKQAQTDTEDGEEKQEAAESEPHAPEQPAPPQGMPQGGQVPPQGMPQNGAPIPPQGMPQGGQMPPQGAPFGQRPPQPGQPFGQGMPQNGAPIPPQGMPQGGQMPPQGAPFGQRPPQPGQPFAQGMPQKGAPIPPQGMPQGGQMPPQGAPFGQRPPQPGQPFGQGMPQNGAPVPPQGMPHGAPIPPQGMPQGGQMPPQGAPFGQRPPQPGQPFGQGMPQNGAPVPPQGMPQGGQPIPPDGGQPTPPPRPAPSDDGKGE